MVTTPQAFKSGDPEMVKMVLHHQSAEEDMLLSQSSLGKGGKGGREKDLEGGASAGPEDDGTGAAAADGPSGESGGEPRGQGEDSVSVTHELGFGIGVGASNDEDDGVSFRVRELPIRNPDECFGEDAREDTTGLNLWGAAVVLARWVAEPAMQARLEGKTILELGAGCGAG